MTRTTRASLTVKIVVCFASLACASLIPAAVAAGAEIALSYQNESLNEFQQQLAGSQIQAVTINKRLRTLHVTLKDGRYVLATYARHEEPTIAAALNAKHVSVTVLTEAEALKEAAKRPVHHKIRYIAGGVLIVLIVLVVGVVFIKRRRQRALD
jgi:ATP-dependent Zn protease